MSEQKEVVRAALADAKSALEALLADEAMLETIARAGHLIAQSQRAGGAVYSCGNGGSLITQRLHNQRGRSILPASLFSCNSPCCALILRSV